MRPLRVGGLFTGVGAHHEALKAMDLPGGYEVVFQCEADPRTASAYDLAHGPTPNLGDVRDIENLDAWPVDLLVASPPCQDISVAGKGAGLGEEARPMPVAAMLAGYGYEMPRRVWGLGGPAPTVRTFQGGGDADGRPHTRRRYDGFG